MAGPEIVNMRPERPKQTAALGAIFLVLVCGAAGFMGGWYGSEGRQQTNNNVAVQQKNAADESQLINRIAKTTGPSVVSVNVISQTVAGNDFFGFGPVDQESAGSGVIISESGYVITNRHVIPAGTKQVKITLSDGTTLDNVEVIGRTGENDPLDVAFLKVKDAKGKKLQPAKFGDSSKVQVGDKVVAIGNALGRFQNTVTEGIISGFGRSVEAGDSTSVETLQNLLQTDAAINQGNSGGPLVSISGEVIGINTAIAGGQAQNIGFAIPIDDIKGLINSVITKGKVERSYLGVRYVNLTDDYAYEFNLNTKRGAYIAPSSQSPILPGSPAAKAGLKEKDIITKVDGTAIDENHSLTSLVGRHAVGDEVTLTIIRDGKEQNIKVKLEAAPTG